MFAVFLSGSLGFFVLFFLAWSYV